MFCRFCGKENKDGSKFCKYCGKSMAVPSANTPGPAARSEEKPDTVSEDARVEISEERPDAVSGNVQAAISEERPDARMEDTQDERQGSGTGRKLLIALIIILDIILVLLAVVFVLYIRSDARTPLDMIFEQHEEDTQDEADEPDVEAVKDEDVKDSDDKDTGSSDDTDEDKSVMEDKKTDEGPAPKDETIAFKDNTSEDDTSSSKGSETEDEVAPVAETPAEEEYDPLKLTVKSCEATSELKATSKDKATYNSSNAIDSNFATAWVEGVDGDGTGECITLYLDGIHKISSVKIYNGYLKTKRRYSINGRASKVVIEAGDGYTQTADLNVMYPPEQEIAFSDDELGETEIMFTQPCETDKISITIMGVVSGTKYKDTAISEIEVYGN